MSYRELRNFAEQMRALGYQRIVSVENFRTPNFELVASVLYWMVKRYDPDISVSDSIETEDDRIEFLTTVANAFASKAKIRLNTKKLYAADGRAVKELLKVASMLYRASRVNEEETAAPPEVISLSSRIKDIKAARTLATDVTELGAKLYDLLGTEKEVKPERQRALSFLDTISSTLDNTPEHRHIQKSINDLIATARDDAENTKKQCDELQADERALDAKIKKKQSELERHEKRLKSLQTVRPAFMDEYEKLEKDLEKQYAAYLERYRNLDYLQFELDTYNKTEKEKMEENDRSLKRMQKRLREEELRLLRGDEELNDQSLDETLAAADTNRDASRNKRAADDDAITTKPKAASSSSNAANRRRSSHARDGPSSRVQGTMDPSVDADDDESDIDSDEISHDSESDSVSIAPSSNNGSDDIDDDDEASEMSEGEEDESNYASGHSSTGEF
ncbi:hypothetical protein CTAYLR_005234 [Chrysophaeum taylorii]|uniref:Clusterin-associated protein 1 n=1 Tax=Chrysophaeum taylorii TaxID=2483200 RepID=A0AAD7UBM1_9STRA|nr:hypothetical protein CTAYLR_005234 [Chrysophaeum taylorii]